MAREARQGDTRARRAREDTVNRKIQSGFPFFMRIDPAGWPFVVGGLTITLVVGFLADAWWAVVPFTLTAFLLFFFRDPDRVINAPDSAVLSPADGQVMVAGQPTVQTFPAERWRQVSIFLSPMDVHVNRMPVSGRVVRVQYHPGRFLPAYRADAGDLNEYTEVTLDVGGHVVVVRQIVGILARRIVCRVTEGAEVKAGDRFGVMKFGSRMDVFLPAGTTIHARVGEKAVAGVTILGTLPAREEGTHHAT
jgi:phosphatidylserine decarboxylase